MEINFNKGSTRAHQDLGKAFLKAASLAFPDIVVISYTVGMFRDFDTANRIIHAGQKGVPDWIIFGNGWYLFFDIKTGKAKFSKEQMAFKKRISEISNGGEFVYKINSVDQALNIIKNAKEFYAKNRSETN